ncbi:MAG: phage holin family protein, partial [Deltaproteobacteria bacterium]|nr:phage holin family protein [Deltaproteobacteria bacterium]
VIFLVARGGLLKADSFVAALAGSVVLALVNAFVKPVLRFIALPLTIATLGLFALVLNVLLFYLVVTLVPGLETVGFVQTVVAAFVVSVTTAVVTKIAGL